MVEHNIQRKQLETAFVARQRFVPSSCDLCSEAIMINNQKADIILLHHLKVLTHQTNISNKNC